jgi:hypothetical protein
VLDLDIHGIPLSTWGSGKITQSEAVRHACRVTLRDRAGAARRCQQSAAPVGCELHFWPASEAHSAIQGSNARDSFDYVAGSHRKAIAPFPADRQIALAQSLNLADLLGLPGYRLIAHDKGLGRMEATGAATRHAESTSACYAELIVSQLVFDDAWMSDPTIRELIVLRRFGDSQTVATSFSTWVKQRVPHRRQLLVEADFESAFRANLIAFGQFATSSKSRTQTRRRHQLIANSMSGQPTILFRTRGDCSVGAPLIRH